ncbi:MAG: hypothetical protein FD123_4177 [Bacteroidetes bacterium]|nr:MAG: hypothetical protein FD123_4177 [Bacteroidota bacterium]
MKFLNSKKSISYIQLPSEIESNIILAGGDLALLLLQKDWFVCRGKGKCAKCVQAKIELKKMSGGENKKYRRVGRVSAFLFSVCNPVGPFVTCQKWFALVSIQFLGVSLLLSCRP